MNLPVAIATAALIPPQDGQRHIVIGTQTLKRIPAWLALAEIGLTAWVVLAVALTLLYAPVWLLASLRKAWRRPHELWIRLWPLNAVLCSIAAVAIFHLAGEDLINRLGRITVWSAGLFLATVPSPLPRSPVRLRCGGHVSARSAGSCTATAQPLPRRC